MNNLRCKLLIFTFFISFLSSCQRNDYQGYVFDAVNKQPLSGVSVKMLGEQVQTDANGYFKLHLKTDVAANLVLYKNGYQPDIAETLLIHSGEKLEELFQNGRDTVFLSPIGKSD